MRGKSVKLLEERFFRCAAYAWGVSLVRTIELPPGDTPAFNDLEAAQEYFSRVKRAYTVIDENAPSQSSEHPSWEEAWKAYCRIVGGYVKFFPQLRKAGPELFVQRFDLPDPQKLEPNQ